ncbi:ABC transporter substrate-binding protein [Microseira sp. BLCC-F43]|jgi:branched-chain amino acid transport system substrate-binding protein|uniref:ABC transporter substrate-binding protein n=1 Tax=Microseira sp. BLCC-F43 TaxID=3153602 RepID=UPI0035B9F7B5
MRYSLAGRNPYIIGRPINNAEFFVGRERILRFVDDNLRFGEKVILLDGQRRIGKSSVVRNIPKFVSSDEFVFVPFNLEIYSQATLSTILVDLAKEIIAHLQLDERIKPPSIPDLEKDPYIFYSQFLTQVYQALGEKNLVLLLDEFDIPGSDYSVPVVQELFPYLHSILEVDKKLFTVLCLGRQSPDLPNLLRLFKGAPYQEIGLLDEASTKYLITKPAEGVLTYEEEAIKAILELSGGHPYFTQVICFSIFGQARDLDNWTVTRADVERIVGKAIESAEAGLAWFWDGLSRLEKVVFSAAAEAETIASEKADKFPENLLKLLKSYGVPRTESLVEAAKQLVARGFLDDKTRKVKIELVRRWLLKRHPVEQEVRELKKLEKVEAKIVNSRAIGGQLSGQKQDLAIAPIIPADAPVVNKRVLLGTVAAIGVISAAVGFGVYRLVTPCPPGQEKVLGISCVADGSNISRGDRTFFPITGNPNRTRGIAAFKQGNYSQAAQFFKLAVADNRNDPEVLIYYNNALAKQQGSPITLAAVVPVDNQEPIAKEILRGVAQAQNEFNEKGGLNGRLLEIVIANDANTPEQAKQIAADLVKDKSVLGVIGHYSSDATKSALNEYKKAEIATISPTSTSTSLQGDNFFRTVPSDAAAAQKLAEYARKSLDLNSVVIFYNPDSSYSDSLREEFTKNFEKLGGSVVRRIDLTESQFNGETEVAKSLYEDRSQAIVLFPDEQNTDVALKIATANAQQTQGLKLLGGDALYSQTILNEGNRDLEGLILAVSWFREAPQAKKFATAAAQQWGGNVNWRTASSYDATQAFIQALSPNPTRATVMRRLQNINLSASETSGDSLKFTPQGERQNQPKLVKVEGGKFRLLQ